jgi:hypothetical protein
MCTLLNGLRAMLYLGHYDYQCYSLGLGLLQIRECDVLGTFLMKQSEKR